MTSQIIFFRVAMKLLPQSEVLLVYTVLTLYVGIVNTIREKRYDDTKKVALNNNVRKTTKGSEEVHGGSDELVKDIVEGDKLRSPPRKLVGSNSEVGDINKDISESAEIEELLKILGEKDTSQLNYTIPSRGRRKTKIYIIKKNDDSGDGEDDADYFTPGEEKTNHESMGGTANHEESDSGDGSHTVLQHLKELKQAEEEESNFAGETEQALAQEHKIAEEMEKAAKQENKFAQETKQALEQEQKFAEEMEQTAKQKHELAAEEAEQFSGHEHNFAGETEHTSEQEHIFAKKMEQSAEQEQRLAAEEADQTSGLQHKFAEGTDQASEQEHKFANEMEQDAKQEHKFAAKELEQALEQDHKIAEETKQTSELEHKFIEGMDQAAEQKHKLAAGGSEQEHKMEHVSRQEQKLEEELKQNANENKHAEEEKEQAAEQEHDFTEEGMEQATEREHRFVGKELDQAAEGEQKQLANFAEQEQRHFDNLAEHESKQFSGLAEQEESKQIHSHREEELKHIDSSAKEEQTKTNTLAKQYQEELNGHAEREQGQLISQKGNALFQVGNYAKGEGSEHHGSYTEEQEKVSSSPEHEQKQTSDIANNLAQKEQEQLSRLAEEEALKQMDRHAEELRQSEQKKLFADQEQEITQLRSFAEQEQKQTDSLAEQNQKQFDSLAEQKEASSFAEHEQKLVKDLVEQERKELNSLVKNAQEQFGRFGEHEQRHHGSLVKQEEASSFAGHEQKHDEDLVERERKQFNNLAENEQKRLGVFGEPEQRHLDSLAEHEQGEFGRRAEELMRHEQKQFSSLGEHEQERKELENHAGYEQERLDRLQGQLDNLAGQEEVGQAGSQTEGLLKQADTIAGEGQKNAEILAEQEREQLDSFAEQYQKQLDNLAAHGQEQLDSLAEQDQEQINNFAEQEQGLGSLAQQGQELGSHIEGEPVQIRSIADEEGLKYINNHAEEDSRKVGSFAEREQEQVDNFAQQEQEQPKNLAKQEQKQLDTFAEGMAQFGNLVGDRHNEEEILNHQPTVLNLETDDAANLKPVNDETVVAKPRSMQASDYDFESIDDNGDNENVHHSKGVETVTEHTADHSGAVHKPHHFMNTEFADHSEDPIHGHYEIMTVEGGPYAQIGAPQLAATIEHAQDAFPSEIHPPQSNLDEVITTEHLKNTPLVEELQSLPNDNVQNTPLTTRTQDYPSSNDFIGTERAHSTQIDVAHLSQPNYHDAMPTEQTHKLLDTEQSSPNHQQMVTAEYTFHAPPAAGARFGPIPYNFMVIQNPQQRSGHLPQQSQHAVMVTDYTEDAQSERPSAPNRHSTQDFEQIQTMPQDERDLPQSEINNGAHIQNFQGSESHFHTMNAGNGNDAVISHMSGGHGRLRREPSGNPAGLMVRSFSGPRSNRGWQGNGIPSAVVQLLNRTSHPNGFAASAAARSGIGFGLSIGNGLNGYSFSNMPLFSGMRRYSLGTGYLPGMSMPFSNIALASRLLFPQLSYLAGFAGRLPVPNDLPFAFNNAYGQNGQFMYPQYSIGGISWPWRLPYPGLCHHVDCFAMQKKFVS